jgi:glycosyltransferase involved in cell wall biosynthesis
MRLGVDARMMYGAWAHRGIGRFTKSILQQLPADDIVAFLPEKQTLKKYKTYSKGSSFFAWWEQIVLPGMVKNEKIDYLLCPSITSPIQKFRHAKKIVVVYDLIFMQPFSELPPSHSLYNNLGRLYRRLIAPRGYKTADLLISISEFSRDELYQKFGIPKEKVHIIPCSISADWYVAQSIAAGLREKYLITVTGDAPSKNLSRLLQAFANIINLSGFKNFRLVIIGVAQSSKDVFVDQAKKLNIEGNVVFEGFLDNNQLQQKYREAWGALTLSLYEGFGIPIVEAMASGTPLVCSNTTSMPEVAGDAAIYADPTSIDSMTEAILKIVSASAMRRDEMALCGMARSRKFSEQVVKEKIQTFWNSLK